MELALALIVLIAFSVISFWQGRGVVSCVLWLMTSGIAVLAGLLFADIYPDFFGVGMMVLLSVIYGAFCIVHSFSALLRETDQ